MASEVAASLIVAVGDDSYLQDLPERHLVEPEECLCDLQCLSPV